MKNIKEIMHSKKILKLFALFGIIVNIMYYVVFITLGLIRAGYNPMTQFISELGEAGAPNALIASAFFLILGILYVLFSYALYNGIQKEKGSWIGPLLLALVGIIDLIGSAIFPCDPGCVAQTSTGRIHLLLSLIGMILVIITPFFVWRSIKKDERWQAYQTLTLIFWILIIVMFGVFMVIYSANILIGLFQRIFYGLFLLWMLILAIKLITLFNQLES